MYDFCPSLKPNGWHAKANSSIGMNQSLCMSEPTIFIGAEKLFVDYMTKGKPTWHFGNNRNEE
jgi:hypothetical protein